MKIYTRSLLLLFSLSLSMPLAGPAQAWSGIISSSRASDWPHAGLPGNVPPDATWTQCGSTIAPYGSSGSPSSAPTINSAIASCGTYHYVLLGNGDFYLSTCIDFTSSSGTPASNVVLRGGGANNTRIHFASGTTDCGSLFGGSNINLGAHSGMWSGGGYDQANWTSGFSQGITTITLDNVTGITPNLTPIVLDQCNTGFTGTAGSETCTGSWTDNGNFNVCDVSGVCESETAVTGVYRTNRAEAEIVIATSITGSGPYTVTLAEPISNPQWSSRQTPEAWWDAGGKWLTNSGIENLLIDTASDGYNAIGLGACYKCWVTGVATDYANYLHIDAAFSSNVLIANNYSFQTAHAATESYGIGGAMLGDLLVENNILQQVATPLSLDGSCAPSCVFAYNFSIDPYYNNLAYMADIADTHAAGIAQVLYEGNIGSELDQDGIHGSKNMFTMFRNYASGLQANNLTTPGIPSGTISVTAGRTAVTWVSGATFQSDWAGTNAVDTIWIYNPSTSEYLNYWLSSVNSSTSITLSGDIASGGTGTVNYFVAPNRDTDAMHWASYMRYMNAIGNAIGTAGFHTAYQCLAPNQTISPCANNGRSVYDLGYSSNTAGQISDPGTTPYDDPLVGTTAMRWGNYDVVSGAVRWCGNSSDTGWSTTCVSASEIPTTDSYYPNSVPTVGDTGAGMSRLPSSFYNGVTGEHPSCGTGLSFWKNPTTGTCPPYPPIGPDVSGGNIGECSTAGSNYLWSLALSRSQCGSGSLTSSVMAGHVNANPAMACYLNQMSGPPDGTGSMLTFNASACYETDGPAPPTNLTATPQP